MRSLNCLVGVHIYLLVFDTFPESFQMGMLISHPMYRNYCYSGMKVRECLNNTVISKGHSF